MIIIYGVDKDQVIYYSLHSWERFWMKKSLQCLNFLVCFGKVLWSPQPCSEVCLPDDLNGIKLTMKTRHYRCTITSPVFIHVLPVFFLFLLFRVKLIPPEQASILGVHRAPWLKSWFLDSDGSFLFHSLWRWEFFTRFIIG